MYRACIAIADATRARVFAFERTADESGVHEELIEQADLVNPARRRRPSELFSDTRPGTSRSGGRQDAFDDHRDAHVDKLDGEFASATAAEIRRIVRDARARRLIVCASPRMLGELRRAHGELRHAGLAVDEIPKDLVKLSPTQLRDQLESYGVLPRKPGAA